MKKYFFFFGILMSLSAYGQTDAWLQMDSINGPPRSVASSFSLGNYGYVACGLDLEGFRRKVYSYGYVSNDWDDDVSLGGINGGGLNRGSASGFAVNGKGYVCLGQGDTNPFFKDMWEFDPATNAWTQKADFMGSARRQAVAFAIGIYAYVGTGIDVTGMKDDMYRYHPASNTWISRNPFGGSARKEAVGFTMGDQGYVGTGDDGVFKNDFWQYEPTTDTWTQKANFPGTARKGAVGWGVFPQAFICTGEDIGFNYTNDLWEYNYFTDQWVQRASLPGPGRSNAISLVIQGIGFVGSGYGGVLYDDFWAYNKILNTAEVGDYDQLQVYPNPSSEIVNIRVNPNNLSVQLVAIDGKDVTGQIQINTSIDGFHFNKGDLPAGNYIININHSSLGKVHQAKIVIL